MILNVDFENVETTVMTSTSFEVDFKEMNSVFEANFKNDQVLDSNFGEVSVVGDVDVYEGEYIFTPIADEDQTIHTAKKYVERDMVVKPIPYHSVSNNSDGLTVTIG